MINSKFRKPLTFNDVRKKLTLPIQNTVVKKSIVKEIENKWE